MNLTLRQLYAFQAVAEFGSFTRAATRLNTAQPILSTQIRDLEQELGIRLFDRTTRRVELTTAGKEFLAEVDGLVDGLNSAVSRLNHLALRQRGHLAVAAPPLIASLLMPGVFAAFKKENPGIDLTLIDKPTVGILEAIRDRSADLGVGTFASDLTDISSAVIARDELVLLRAGAQKTGKDICWKDLQDEQLITLSEGSGIRTLVDKALHESGVSIRPAFEVEHITTALALVVAGLGVTVLPSYAATQSNLCVQRLRAPDVRRDICVITLRENAPSPAAQAFISLLRGVSNSVIWSRRKPATA